MRPSPAMGDGINFSVSKWTHCPWTALASTSVIYLAPSLAALPASPLCYRFTLLLAASCSTSGRRLLLTCVKRKEVKAGAREDATRGSLTCSAFCLKDREEVIVSLLLPPHCVTGEINFLVMN
ncbi:hypothetical protein E2C01_008017 [Portunus trituberculatus]|uniref:Uncharacterized protein n=1 Tax=Portunus trituberculatus TaxID=210409 RepID=A0A5B7CZP6_PORTR|nr:hypothetical protein [Portunus trituberculatus]